MVSCVVHAFRLVLFFQLRGAIDSAHTTHAVEFSAWKHPRLWLVYGSLAVGVVLLVGMIILKLHLSP
jgi:hypothetical protein